MPRRPSYYLNPKSFDVIRGRYFYFTLLYGVVFVFGGIWGFYSSSSLICLLPSVILGIVFILLGIAHYVDYYSANVAIETVYIVFPCVASLVLFVFGASIYFMNFQMLPYGAVGILCLIGLIFYIYAIIQDFSSMKVRVNNRYQLIDRNL